MQELAGRRPAAAAAYIRSETKDLLLPRTIVTFAYSLAPPLTVFTIGDAALYVRW